MARRALPPTHPGDMLRHEVLPYVDMTRKEFAEHIGVSRNMLQSILGKRKGVGIDTARRLSQALGQSPKFWLNLQTAWDLWHAEKERPVKVVEIFKPNDVGYLKPRMAAKAAQGVSARTAAKKPTKRA